MIGDFLYGITTGETQSQPAFQRYAQAWSASAAASPIVASQPISVPTDKVFLLFWVIATGAGGGAQTVTRLTIDVVTTGARYNLEESGTVGQAIRSLRAFGSPAAILMPGEFLEATGTFSAIVSANSVFVTADRKSTRLNSSHLGISYAVF